MADSRKPKASGQKTSQSMKSEICRACRIALTTNIPGLAPHQPLDGFVELADLLGSPARTDRFSHTMFGVIGQQLEGDALERGPRRVDLGEDVDAVAILLNHVLD